MTVEKPKRRWFRFSLRALLVLITLTCVWLGLNVNAARRQKEAVNAILKADGEVVYDYQMFPEGHAREFLLDSNAAPSEPAWLRKLFGIDFMHTVLGAYLIRDNTMPAADFAQLACFNSLKRLQIGDAKFAVEHDGSKRPIQNSDFISLGKFRDLRELLIDHVESDGTFLATFAPNLTSLVAGNTPVDDAGLEQIGTLDRLKLLRLENTLITDVGLKHLSKLINLEHLSLDGTKVSDAGLPFLSNLSKLRYLNLSRTFVTDAGLEFFGRLTQLERLELNHTSITDEGLKHLKCLVNLKTIWLEEDQGITDSGLKYLAGLKNLSAIHLWHTRSSSEGVRDLQKSLANCQISGP